MLADGIEGHLLSLSSLQILCFVIKRQTNSYMSLGTLSRSQIHLSYCAVTAPSFQIEAVEDSISITKGHAVY